jgi:hypothetical protein
MIKKIGGAFQMLLAKWNSNTLTQIKPFPNVGKNETILNIGRSSNSNVA